MSERVVPVGEEQVIETVLDLADRTVGWRDADLTPLSDEAIEACLRAWEDQLRYAAACRRTLLAQASRRGLAATRRCSSESVWLQHLLNVSGTEANRRLREVAWLSPRTELTGQVLPPRYPVLAAAADDAAVTGEHVEVIARALDALPATIDQATRAAAEARLVTEARTLLPRQTRQAAYRLGEYLDPDGTLATERDQRDQRDQASVTLSKGLHGMWNLRGLLDPDSGATLKTALDALSKPVPGPDGERDPRDAGKRQADALTQIARWSLDASGMPAHGGRKPQLVLTTTLAEFRGGRGLATTQWGDQVTAETTARHGCDTELVRATLDPYGAILNLGRTVRLITPDQRRALNLRDKGCIFPGCDRPPAWCQGHHILDWIKGGRTDLDNLCLLCTKHHTEVHQNGWQIVMLHGRPHCVPPPWIDPHQRPRRNTAHDPPALVPADLVPPDPSPVLVPT